MADSFFQKVGDWLVDAGNWVGDTFFGGSHSTNEVNAQIAQDNIAYQQAANDQNIAFQKQENEITRMREDNAVTRAAQDMANAGLSKTLAAGNPASAQALQSPRTEALNNSFQMQRNLAGLNAMKEMQNITNMIKENKRADSLNDANIAKLEAEKDYYDSITAGNNIDNGFKADEHAAQLVVLSGQAASFQAQARLDNASAVVQEIVGDFKAQEIEQDIAYKVSQTFKNYADVKLTKSQIDKLAVETANDVLKGKGFKIDNIQKWNQLKIQTRELSKMYYEIEGMKRNLNYARKMDLPIGATPGSLFGINIGAANSLLSGFGFTNPNYTGLDLNGDSTGRTKGLTLPLDEFAMTGEFPMFIGM